ERMYELGPRVEHCRRQRSSERHPFRLRINASAVDLQGKLSTLLADFFHTSAPACCQISNSMVAQLTETEKKADKRGDEIASDVGEMRAGPRHFGGGLKASREKQLIKQLMRDYEKQGRNGRPLLDHTDSIKVNFSLSLIQIMDVDEKNQVLKTNVWYHYIWTDELLRWVPAKHDNITSVRVPSEKIWLPDVLLYNFGADRLGVFIYGVASSRLDGVAQIELGCIRKIIESVTAQLFNFSRPASSDEAVIAIVLQCMCRVVRVSETWHFLLYLFLCGVRFLGFPSTC
ncbi:hypothetical protein BaRGS_00010422, partial [Batillaria attramentaria]